MRPSRIAPSLTRTTPHLEVPLRRRPDDHLAILAGAGERRVRLDIALVDRLRREAALDHDLRLAEARRGIALGEIEALGDVRCARRLGLDPFGAQVVVQDRRAVLHRRLDVDDVRQHLVVDLDERERVARDRLAGRRDRGDGVALIERLVARHDVAADVAQVDLHLAGRDDLVGLRREVLAGHHRLDTGQRLGGRGVDRPDHGMGVRAAQHLADQLSRHVEVGAEARATGDLVGTVGTVGAGADPLVAIHRAVSLISAAASMTAWMILSYPVQRHRLPASQ
jgi:hypothetical protein